MTTTHDDTPSLSAGGGTTPTVHGEPRPRTVPWTRLAVLAGVAAAILLGVWALRARAAASRQQADAAARSAADRVVPVLTADVARRDVPLWREGLGTVAAFYTVNVKTQVDGRIDRVLFTEGQHVKKGDVLVQIDPRPFQIQLLSAQAALARDQANLKNAQLNLERYKTLSSQKLIAQQQFTDQEAAVAQLDAQARADEAAVASARLNLDYARITSPIDGVVGVRQIDPGNVVHASDANGLVVVTQLDPIALFFTLPEDDLAAIRAASGGGPGLGVEAFARDGETRLGEGKLTVIDNQINQATATIRLKAIFDNPQGMLWPNQFVKARLHLTTRENALVVPAVAVQRGPQGTFVYVVANGAAEARPVDVVLAQGEIAVLAKGVAPGDAVVVEGQAQLRPGAKVSAKPASAAASSGPASSNAAPALAPRGAGP